MRRRSDIVYFQGATIKGKGSHFLGEVDTPLHTMSIGYKIIRSKNSETFCITEKHQRWSFFPAKLPNFYFNLTSLSKKWDKNLQKIFLVENLRTVAFGN